MMYKSTAFALSFGQTLRAGHLPPLSMLLRIAGAQLSSLAFTVVRPADNDEALRPGLGRRLRQTITDVYTLAIDKDSLSKVEMAVAGDLHDARMAGDAWRARAEAAEKRVAALEVALAASEMAALELRSRVVCLHGKLATSNATVRYQSLTLALEHPPAAPDEGMPAAPEAVEPPRARQA